MIEIACGILFAISIYLILDSHIIRRVFGISLFSNAVNLLLLICGGLDKTKPAFIIDNEITHYSNSLSQALVLTAIVIGLGLLAFLCSTIKSIDKDDYDNIGS